MRQHLASAGHNSKAARKANMKSPANIIHCFSVEKDRARKDAGQSFVTRQDTDEERLRVVFACLKDLVPLNVFASRSALGIRAVLEETRQSLNGRELRDLVPNILEMATIEVKKELRNVTAISLSFDGTPKCCEVFAVNIRFIREDGVLVQRCIALKLYTKGFTHQQLAAQLVRIMLEEWQFPRETLRFSVCDGCPTNTAGIRALLPLFTEMGSVICISHSANVVGKLAWTFLPLAKRFQEKWSNMLTISFRARQLFFAHSLVPAEMSSETRWYSAWEVCKQIYSQSAAVRTVVHADGDFSESLRTSMRDMLADNVVQALRVELALMSDGCCSLTKLCYMQEGDGCFLCVTTYDHWHAVQKELCEMTDERTSTARRRALLPNLTSILGSIHNGGDAVDAAVKVQAKMLLPVYEKMKSDSDGRLAETLKVFRACRLFGYRFIASTPLLALQEELVQLLNLHICNRLTEDAFLLELNTYRAEAVRAVGTGRTAMAAAMVASNATAAVVAGEVAAAALAASAAAIADRGLLEQQTMADAAAAGNNNPEDEALQAGEAHAAAATATAARIAEEAARKVIIVAAEVDKRNEALLVSDEDFWNRCALKLPTFYQASREVALIMPSSATTERLFAMLTQGYSDQQRCVLQDHQCASVMIRYNNTGDNGV